LKFRRYIIYVSYHPRNETADYYSFQTTRCRNSELWFVNNPQLEEVILSKAAKCATKYEADIYALAIEGNHIQFPAFFPKLNRAHFMRDFNSYVALAVGWHVPTYSGGRLWGRRYSQEFVPSASDLEEEFFYTVLQAVQDGLVERISDYPAYNCFHDAVWGIKRKFKLVRWRDYRAAKKRNHKIAIRDYTEIYTLNYKRLPGYEHLPQREYALMMEHKLEERRQKIVAQRTAQGLRFMGPEKLRQVIPGSLPGKTKTSTENSHRPRVLSRDPELRQQTLEWYFARYYAYKKASKRYRSGDVTVEFPPGTYKPFAIYKPPPENCLN
jgi:hypothetical protein